MTEPPAHAVPTGPRTPVAVVKAVTVGVAVAHAFDVFSAGFATWWPLDTHHIGAVDCIDAVMEPFAGGRWYERGADGSECDWGRVLVWEPPRRLVLAWQLDADWAYDPAFVTEVEVRFVAEGPRTTRVELEHRGLEAYGHRTDEVRGAVSSDGGWQGLLEAFARAAAC